MRPLLLATLAALLLAPRAGAQEALVPPGPVTPGHTVAVSWRVPAGFEESELLLVVDGGPRVRLTDELRGESPRAVVRVPALVGTARFLVRAGRKNEAGRHEEVDLATSERFPLSYASAPGPVPVRAPATRPAPGETMEWWSEASGRIPEGPSSGVEGSAATREQTGPTFPAALPPDPAGAGPAPSRTIADSREAERAARGSSERGFPDRTFAGAPVPLRN